MRVHGGPAMARATGEVRGERVSALFDLTDVCEIARWPHNTRLLGASVRTGSPAP
jgi:hypothetical protein